MDAWVILLVSFGVHGNGVWRWRVCADAVHVTLQQLSARIQHTIYAIAEKVRFWLSRYYMFHASLTVATFSFHRMADSDRLLGCTRPLI